MSFDKGKINILVVEDDQGLSLLISEIIEDMDYSILQAFDGDGALDILSHYHIDLMLLDFNLPDITGKQLLNTIAQKNLTLPPFLIVTGAGDEQLAVDMMKIGACDYLVKDSKLLSSLPTIVSRVLREKESELKLIASEQALKESEIYNRLLFQDSSLPS